MPLVRRLALWGRDVLSTKETLGAGETYRENTEIVCPGRAVTALPSAVMGGAGSDTGGLGTAKCPTALM